MNTRLYGNCKTAVLQSIMQLQSYGALLAISPVSGEIVAASDNIHEYIIDTSEQVLGKAWSAYLKPEHISAMFRLDIEAGNVTQIKHTKLLEQNVELSHHIFGDLCIVEIEPAKKQNITLNFAQRTAFIESLACKNLEEDIAKVLMNKIADLIKFDRVMLYKFLPNWHGEVIHEALAPGVEGFLGLRFPESDLPANVRRLYTVNCQRLIANVDEPSANIDLLNETVSLDLTYSQLRAVHPVHIKYLQNMGVSASFSLSIICNGKLWGLIVCHHLQPKMLTCTERQICEELTKICSLHLTNSFRANMEQDRYVYRTSISEIRGSLRSQTNFINAINSLITSVKKLFNANGVWHHFDGDDSFCGTVPDQTSLSVLGNWLEKLNTSEVFLTFEVPKELSNHPAIVRFAAGFIYIPLSQNNFILITRHEQLENVNWAGKPQSIENDEYSVAALTPRASFHQWSQQLHGRCMPWSELDVEAAEQLRDEVLDFIDRSKLESMALSDSLTGLSNRLRFEKELESSIFNSIEKNTTFAVFMIDLDKFKPVNDTFGHAAGDELLIFNCVNNSTGK